MSTTRAKEKTKAPRAVRVLRVERSATLAAPVTLTVEIGSARLHVPSGADEATLRATIGTLLAAVNSGAH